MFSAHTADLLRREAPWLVLLLLLVLGWVGALAHTSSRLQEAALAQGHTLAQVHVRHLEQHFTHALQVVHLTAAGLQQVESLPTPLSRLDAYLADIIAPIPAFRSLSLVDGIGIVRASSHPRNMGVRFDLSSGFPLANGRPLVLQLGLPWRGRDLYDAPAHTAPAELPARDLLAVPVLMGLSLAGQPYTLVAVLNPDYFAGRALAELPEPQGHVDWLRYDGRVLMSSDGTAGAAVGYLDQDMQRRLQVATQGAYDGPHRQREVLTAYRSSAHYPALVQVHVHREQVLAQWQREVRQWLLVALPLLLIVLVGAGLFLRHQVARHRQEREHERSRRLAASVFDSAAEGIMITDPTGRIVEVNPAFVAITGYSRAEVMGHNARLLSSGHQDRAFYASMWQALAERGAWSGEVWNRRKSGEVYAELLSIRAVRDQDGRTVRYVALFSDITQKKEVEARLVQMAHFDALTGLPNRMLLGDRLRQAMAQSLRTGLKVAVVMLDLDGFKAVNDLHGHDAGDRLLVSLAGHMRGVLRDGDTLARLGGDEFVAVLVGIQEPAACVSLLERLLQAATEPLPVDGTRVQVSASLGVSFFPQADDIDADQLLRQADQAMYQAKLNGKHRYQFFDTEQDREVRQRHATPR